LREEEEDDDDDDDMNIISEDFYFFLQLLKFTSTKKQREGKKKGDVLKECLAYRRISNPEAIIIELEILKARNLSILLLYSILYLYSTCQKCNSNLGRSWIVVAAKKKRKS
jgi:hypothetical protein